MAPTHKMSIDYCEVAFSLIALHTSLEDYSVAYWLNKQLKTRFKRKKKDHCLPSSISFSLFDWLDVNTDSYWTLLSNKNIGLTSQKRSQDLFSETPLEEKHYLIPEHPQVDYFLKIEDEGYINKSKLIGQINQIPLILTAFEVTQNQLKSKNNLIF